MTQKELVKNIVEKTKVPAREVKEVLEAFTDVITESLMNKEPVKIHKFGVFKVTKRKARKSKLHGKTYEIPSRYSPEFNFSGNIKEAIHKLK